MEDTEKLWRNQENVIYNLLCSITKPCPILCGPMDCSPPGSSVHGILQARILEQVVISYSRGSSCPRYQTCVSCIFCIGRRDFYHSCHLGSPFIILLVTLFLLKESIHLLWATWEGCKRWFCLCHNYVTREINRLFFLVFFKYSEFSALGMKWADENLLYKIQS